MIWKKPHHLVSRNVILQEIPDQISLKLIKPGLFLEKTEMIVSLPMENVLLMAELPKQMPISELQDGVGSWRVSCMFLRSTAGWLSRANFPAHPLFQHLIVRPTRGKEEAMAWSHDRKYGINAQFHRQPTTRGMSLLTYQLLLLLLPEKERWFPSQPNQVHTSNPRSFRPYLISHADEEKRKGDESISVHLKSFEIHCSL